MASDQVRREKTTVEREVVIEKDKVPKMTSHFESLTEKAKDSDISGGKETPHESGKDRSDDSRARSGNTVGEVGAPGKARESHELGTHEFESLSGKVKDRDEERAKDRERESYADKARNANMVGDKEAEARKEKQEHEEKTGGPHNVGKFEFEGEEGRSASEAQGKMEGHEEKGRSRKMQRTQESHEEKGRGGEMQRKGQSHEENERTRGMEGKEEGLVKQEQPSLEQISQLRGEAQQKSMETLRAAEERYNQTKEEARRKLGAATEYAAEKDSQAKDTVLQGAQQTSQYVAEKGSQAKDTALEKGQQGYEAAKDTLYKAKDYTVPKAEQAKDYALEKANEGKEAAVDTTKKVASYTEENATAAKESGKGAAEYAGKVAVGVKDKAVVAGWSTAHYTTEKAVEGTAAVAKAAQHTTEKVVEGTKAAVRAVEGAAEYAGHKAVEIVSKPLGAAREAAAGTGESMKEYTARKKEESQRELDSKRAKRQDTERGYQEGENQGEQQYLTGEDVTGPIREDKEQQQSLTTKIQEKVEDVARPITSTVQETFRGASEQGKQEKETTEYRGDEGRGGGVFQAIGETVVEIAQTTKDLVIGEGDTGEKILGRRSSHGEGQQTEVEHRQ